MMLRSQKKRPASYSDTSRQQANGGIRTHNHRSAKLDGDDSKSSQNQGDTGPAGLVAPKSVPSEPENALDTAIPDRNRLAVVADLLAGSPVPIVNSSADGRTTGSTCGPIAGDTKLERPSLDGMPSTRGAALKAAPRVAGVKLLFRLSGYGMA